MKCQVSGCNHDGKYRYKEGMLCKKHYNKLKNRGSLDVPDNFVNNICIVIGCKNKATRKGLCGKHYRRYLKHGNTAIKKNRYSDYIKDAKCILCGNNISRQYGSLKFCSDRCSHISKQVNLFAPAGGLHVEIEK